MRRAVINYRSSVGGRQLRGWPGLLLLSTAANAVYADYVIRRRWLLDADRMLLASDANCVIGAHYHAVYSIGFREINFLFDCRVTRWKNRHRVFHVFFNCNYT